jgi:dipeptidyl aminopeptidase/acylaminoacyl peptidase
MMRKRRRGLALLAAAVLVPLLPGCDVSGPDRTPAPPVSMSPATSVSPPFRLDKYEPPEVSPERMKALVAGHADRPLGVTIRATTNDQAGGVAVADLAFDDGFGGTVEAYLVTPLRARARLAGVVFAHGSDRDRSRFLPEAKTLAVRGVAVLLPTVPMTFTWTAATDVEFVRRAVIIQRRAVDVLAARPDVDPGRLGFAGHSWGGVQAGIMAGAEPRLAAVVVASFTQRLTRYLDGTKDYTDQVTVFDHHRWLALPGSRRVLLQAGTLDGWHPPAATDALFAGTAEPKERKDYALGHDLVTGDAAPADDRRAFFARTLGLG